ncbi:hypothetical protein Rfer_4473 (plasmid) [Rhodoferax ferrireducens T118]|uniref:Uncharacterized protein n=1 Tax=Albidiferax ferrireducens (strain ATCC BAA-621 / DSM 15236 / T118) TaxID=338969 RepID=Q21PY6_ALBFT|nr:hypothetical protein [Rhodoferax ferrireducens]ABD72159.1 hypothetical protein Rfer_4473 [Rhodoferax ferrireducens T118]
MNTKSKFKMVPAVLKQGIRYCGLSFTVKSETEGFFDPVTREACGDSMDYGKLFAYLFRRFGYPNRGWDGYKELTKYVLTTPHSDMVLSVVPYVGDNTSLHFTFLVPMEVLCQINDYGQRFRNAWEERALDWREKLGLPDWMSEWMEFCNTSLRAQFHNLPQYNNWRETLPWMMSLGSGKGRSKFDKMTRRANQFCTQLHADFEKVEAEPGYCERSPNWREWDDEDPIKPFADAAFAALRDLHRPVGVRDQEISAFGVVNSTRQPLAAPAVAGYPSGMLGNAAPEGFAELHGLVLKLGNGNARSGIKKAIAMLAHKTAQSPS